MKCEKCGQAAENTVGGVCFDCIATFDDGEVTRLYKKMTFDMLKNYTPTTIEKPKPIKVEFFESTKMDVLKEKLEEFFEIVNNIISINYAVFAGRYHVMVVYT
jgi:hypothetical protein